MAGRSERPAWPRSLRSMWVLLAMLITGADYLLKEHMVAWLAARGNHVEVLPFLNLVASRNTGVAFGVFADLGVDQSQVLVAVAFAICMGAYAFLLLYRRLDLRLAFIATLVLGGGLGNALDRLIHGSVFDFIDVHAFGWHWPAFNLADMAISLAVILLLYESFRKPKPLPVQDKNADQAS